MRLVGLNLPGFKTYLKLSGKRWDSSSISMFLFLTKGSHFFSQSHHSADATPRLARTADRGQLRARMLKPIAFSLDLAEPSSTAIERQRSGFHVRQQRRERVLKKMGQPIDQAFWFTLALSTPCEHQANVKLTAGP